MSLQSRLRSAALNSHAYCDGRFCELSEHPEMQAIERIAELEAENERQREALQEIADSTHLGNSWARHKAKEALAGDNQ